MIQYKYIHTRPRLYMGVRRIDANLDQVIPTYILLIFFTPVYQSRGLLQGKPVSPLMGTKSSLCTRSRLIVLPPTILFAISFTFSCFRFATTLWLISLQLNEAHNHLSTYLPTYLRLSCPIPYQPFLSQDIGAQRKNKRL